MQKVIIFLKHHQDCFTLPRKKKISNVQMIMKKKTCKTMDYYLNLEELILMSYLILQNPFLVKTKNQKEEELVNILQILQCLSNSMNDFQPTAPFRGHLITTWTKRGARWSQKSLFLYTFRAKNVHVEVGGGQKRAHLCPRSH